MLESKLTEFHAGASPFAPRFRQTLNQNFGRCITDIDIGPGLKMERHGGKVILWASNELDDGFNNGGDESGTLASPATVGTNTEGVEAANATTWSKSSPPGGTDGLDLWMISRVGYFHAGNRTLYAYARKLTFDSAGALRTVSDETRVTVDVPETCS